MSSNRTGVVRVATAAATSAVLLAGCGGIADVPLPGGAQKGPGYNVTIIFDDVLDLAKQSAVRVNDVAVGDVTGITLDNFKAKVTIKLDKSAVLPANAVADLRQTSLLGEKYVSLAPPPAPEKAFGQLKDGAVIPNDRTGRNAEFEEVFSALSALLNGGGVAQLQTISVELSNALSGRETKIKDVFRQLDSFVGALDDRKTEITRALDSVDQLGARLARQKQTLARTLDDIPGALKVLADQRSQLTQMLVALSRLGTIGSDVIRNSKANTVADLQALQPVTANLDAAKKNLVGSLELLLNYPFPGTAPNAIHGDYTGLYATVQGDLTQLLKNAVAPSAGGGAPAPPGGLTPPGGLGALGKLAQPQTTIPLPAPSTVPGPSSKSTVPGVGVPNVVGGSYSGDSSYTAIMMQGAAK